MNKNQLNKHVGYLFHNKGYRIPLVPKLDKESIWFLDDTVDSDYPIVCVVLKEKEEHYYHQQYSIFANQLNTNKPLMIINHPQATHWDYTYDYVNQMELFNDLYQSSYYIHDIPDHSIHLIYRKIPLKLSPIKKSVLVNNSALMIFSIICVLVTLSNILIFPNQYSFIAWGYFRYPIVALEEYHRLVTTIFSNGNILLVGIMIYMLFNYLSWFQISYTAKTFWFVVFSSSLFSSIISIILNVEYLNNGLAPIIACFIGIFFFEKLWLYIRYYPHINARIIINYRTIFMIGSLVVFEPIAVLIALVFAMLFVTYMMLKQDSVRLKHYYVALTLLVVAIISMLPISYTNHHSLDYELYQTIKREVSPETYSVFHSWFEQIGEQYEQEKNY